MGDQPRGRKRNQAKPEIESVEREQDAEQPTAASPGDAEPQPGGGTDPHDGDERAAEGGTADPPPSEEAGVEHGEPSLPAEQPSDRKTTQEQQLDDFKSLFGELFDLFVTPAGVPHVTYGPPRRTHPVNSEAVRRFVRRTKFQRFKALPKNAELNDDIRLLEALAEDGQVAPVHRRVAQRDDGSIFVDLADREGRAVRIDKEGWEVVNNPPVHFVRGTGMLPLPEPERGGSLDELFHFLRVAPHDKPLVLAWVTDAMRPQPPYAILALQGEQGSAKSTAARLLRALMDPSSDPLRSPPRSERNLLVSAQHEWLIALDNVGALSDAFSDALCRVATGGALSHRQLFTDTENVLLGSARPIVITSIETVVTRSDLLDRALVVDVPPLTDSERRTETELFAQFEDTKPRLLGALFDALSCALRRWDQVATPDVRLADSMKWASAAEPALGLPDGAVLAAFKQSRDAADRAQLEASPLTAALVELLRTRSSWQGTATELLAALEARASSRDKQSSGWPRSAQALSNMLRRAAPALRRNNIEVDTFRTAQRRVIRVSKRDEAED